jgi:hypothetical protein
MATAVSVGAGLGVALALVGPLEALAIPAPPVASTALVAATSASLTVGLAFTCPFIAMTLLAE